MVVGHGPPASGRVRVSNAVMSKQWVVEQVILVHNIYEAKIHTIPCICTYNQEQLYYNLELIILVSL